MSLQDKYKEYKERQEAKQYFRSQNDQFLNGTQYLKTIGIGLLISIACGIVLGVVISVLSITSSFFYILAGFVVARGITTVSGIQSKQMAVLSVILSFICFVVGEMTWNYIPFHQLGIGLEMISIFDLFIESVRNLFIGDIFTTICVIIGMVIAYQQAQ